MSFIIYFELVGKIYIYIFIWREKEEAKYSFPVLSLQNKNKNPSLREVDEFINFVSIKRKS